MNALNPLVIRSALERQGWQLNHKRLLLPIFLFALLAAPNTHELTVSVLSDAFWQVAAYVAATLVLFHWLTARFDQHGVFEQTLSRHRNLQVVFSALMGALPGCGGAIVVVTQYVRGKISFGGVVAVLTATMGDAAFLLLATRPADGLMMVVMGFWVGLISGMIVDRIHGADFMRPEIKQGQPESKAQCNPCRKPVLRIQGRFWQWMLIPAMVFAVLGSFQVDTDAFFHVKAGTLLCLVPHQP